VVRVLIVDDSPTMRAILTSILSSDPGLEVVGTAADAIEARALIKQLNPDVLTLDIEMPGMSGIDFLQKIMLLRPMPVIIVSTLSHAGTTATLRALEIGAFDCIGKPLGAIESNEAEFARRLIEAVTLGGKSGQRKAPAFGPTPAMLASPVPPQLAPVRRVAPADVQLVAIGASTGGIEALHRLLPSFPANCPPTLLVQHINPTFAGPMAEMLDAKCQARVKLAEPGEALAYGTIYVAPGSERHLTVSNNGRLAVKLAVADKVSGHRPSVDMLFRSVAETVGSSAVGIILTGMGCDGAQGLGEMRRAGAFTVAQDEATCTVYGMPRAAVERGAADTVLPIGRIAQAALGLA
jgi:two-component system, chemotaxis family, protein-glutamate methylesterase/glutaminase